MKRFSKRTKVIAAIVIALLSFTGLYVSSFFTGDKDVVRPGAHLLVETSNGSRSCTAAGTIVSQGRAFAITAGHCGPVGSKVREYTDAFAGRFTLGTIVYSSVYSGDTELNGDWALIEISRSYGTAAGEKYHQYKISENNPTRGSGVCKVGLTTGTTCGIVVNQDPVTEVAVRYKDGSKSGMFPSVKLCAEPGDSGAPLITKENVIGVLSSIDDVRNGCANSIVYYTPMNVVLAGAEKVLEGPVSVLGD